MLHQKSAKNVFHPRQMFLTQDITPPRLKLRHYNSQMVIKPYSQAN